MVEKENQNQTSENNTKIKSCELKTENFGPILQLWQSNVTPERQKTIAWA